jgi:hypothetical protein
LAEDSPIATLGNSPTKTRVFGQSGGNMLTRLVIVAVTTLLSIALGLGQASAEKRVALVVGNGAYTNAPRLPNPANDAADIAAALRRAGFETIVGLDLDRAAMERASIAFARASREADVAMFYYSGHAMQFGGINYLMPTDARLADEADLRLLTKVDDIFSDLQQAKNLRILVLDSCRDNPLADNLKRSLGNTRAANMQRDLAKVDSPQGMIIAYATQAGGRWTGAQLAGRAAKGVREQKQVLPGVRTRRLEDGGPRTNWFVMAG